MCYVDNVSEINKSNDLTKEWGCKINLTYFKEIFYVNEKNIKKIIKVNKISFPAKNCLHIWNIVGRTK